MLGDKIRKLRMELGLSQQQLAGKEMTRAFVSLVESGKSMPSSESLRIIAQRLGKSVDYFLNNEEDDTVSAAVALLESAQRCLEQPAEGSLPSIQRKLQQVLRYVAGLNRADLEAQAHLLYLHALKLQKEHEAILEGGERALECFKELGDREGMARVYALMGEASLVREEFPAARKSYEKALLYTSGLKGLQDLRIEVLTMLGSSLFRLGEYGEAADRYREAIAEFQAFDSPVRWGKLAMGLGWTLQKTGDLKGARHWTTRAVATLKAARSPDYVLAYHNLAMIEAAHGHWEKAYIILRECLVTYQAEGRIAKRASVLEDLARYWMNKGDPAKAEEACWEAIDLLDLQDSSVIRGRIYRLLGLLASDRGDLTQAQSLLRVSHEIFRRLRATQEMADSWQKLQAVRSAASSDT